MTGTASVAAIIVNWNTVDLLDACLRSLRDHGAADMQVIVVDNGSTDGSATMVAEQWPDVTLIANDDNLGYTRANNQAIAVAEGEYLLLINADAMLQPKCLDLMLARMASDPVAAVVGPRLSYADGSFQRWTAGRDPSLGAALRYFLFLERLGPRSGPGRGLYLSNDVRHAFRPDWVSSACMLVRRSALDAVGGGMDETYFCYMDDVELCARLRGAGWHVWYEPDAEAVHLMGQATRRQTGQASPAALRNFNDYVEHRIGPVRAGLIRSLEVIGFGVRAAIYGLSATIRSDDGHRAQAAAHVRNLRVSIQRGPA